MVKNNEWKAEKLDDCQLQLRMVDQYANDCTNGEMQFYNPEAKTYYEPYNGITLLIAWAKWKM